MKPLTTLYLAILLLLGRMLAPAPPALAHCEIPCGIYDDETRFTLLAECVTTIEKSIKELEALSKQRATNYNQIVRWVNNKEHHADQIREIATQYFLAQRIKPVEEKDGSYPTYERELSFLHQIVVLAMKCKQSTEMGNVTKLRELVAGFKKLYLAEQK